MSKVIRSEDAAGCQTWNVPDMQSGNSGIARPMTARQLEEIQAQARQEGFQQGLKEGRNAGRKEFTARIGYLEQLIQSLDEPFASLDQQVEEQLTQLAMLVARQLVRRELQSDPGQVIGVVREALAALPLAARNVRLAVHPGDATMIRDALSLHDGNHDIRIVEDPVQSRGGCRIVTENSQIDATVESRLNAVIANVLGNQRSSDIPDE